MSSRSVFIVAAEPSGDKLGSDLISALKEHDQQMMLHGIGGAAMASVGVESDFDIGPLAILGMTEAVKAYPMVRRKVREATAMIMAKNPDGVVLIDSWGFMIRVAESLGKVGYQGKIIKYVAPQVWAMRPGRAKTLARHVDHLLAIHTMDAPHFEPLGLPMTFVGNPMFDDPFEPGQTGDFKARHDVGEGNVIVALFGSRPAEIESLYEPFAETIAKISKQFPDSRFFSPVTENVRELLEQKHSNDPRTQNVKFLPESGKYQLFANADVALACSGTVTTQLAMSGVPAVVAYKLSPVTFFIAKRLFKPDHISLVNISANRALMKEFVQSDVTPHNLSTSLATFLTDERLREETAVALMAQTDLMKGEGGTASARAASAILKVINAV